MSSDSYIVKWKGRQSGPYTLKEIQEKVASREIKGIYEVLAGGDWKTVRIFLKDLEKISAVAPSSLRLESLQPSSTVIPGKVAPPPPPVPSEPKGAEPPGVGFSSRWSEEPIWESASGARCFESELSRNPEERIVLIYAGFWIRLVAFLFDHTLITVLPLYLMGLFFSGGGGGGVASSIEQFRGLGPLGVVIVILGSILTWIYFAALESSAWCATPGKKIVGLHVTSEDGERITFQTATIRYFAKILSALMIAAGFFLAAFTRKKQGFHDLLAHCTVNFAFRESRILEGSTRPNNTTNYG